MSMLKHPSVHVDVASLQISMLKKLVLDSLSTQDLPKRALRQHVQPEMQEINDQASDTSLDEANAAEHQLEELREQRRISAVRLLESQVETVSSAVHCYWTNHMNEIRHSLSTKNATRSF